MARSKPEELHLELNIFKLGDLYEPFAPWKRNEKGRQVYIKLSKNGREAYLYVGTHFKLQAHVQQGLMRLVNEGWTVEGELVVSFDGCSEPGTDPYVHRDPITIELGRELLPITDPQHGCPLMTKLESLRDEIASEMGVIIPPVRVIDNLKLEGNQYLVKLKDSPSAAGELFLQRLMVLGSHEQLDQLQGWATTEPAHRMRAKWIEPSQVEQAEKLGCLVLGPLTVMITHIKSVLISTASQLLGLQETYDLINRLRPTHPIVVADFLENRTNLRLLRNVLRTLLDEQVSIRDLVTILETVGDLLDSNNRPDIIAEQCRKVLSRQICSSYLDQEGILRGLALSESAEGFVLNLINSGPTIQPAGGEELLDFIESVKKTRQECNTPPVLFTSPRTRPYVRKILARYLPDLGILSTEEIVPGIKVQLCGQVHYPYQPNHMPAKPTKPTSKKTEPEATNTTEGS